jgi:glycosyltransferase involved in cell wall biosynthesis
MLAHAKASVERQTEPCSVVTVLDNGFTTSAWRPGGAATCRNAGIAEVDTEWTAFLDDDDLLYPKHVEKCLQMAEKTDADLVYPWWDGANEDLFRVPHQGQMRTPEGLEFDDELRSFLLGEYEWLGGRDQRNFLPVTVVVKTAMLKKVGGFPIPGTDEWPHPNGEDHGLWIRLLEAGAKFAHLPERTWRYVWHGRHLSHP